MSKKLRSVVKATLEFFEIESDSGEVSLPDTELAKTFVQESLLPPLEIYGQNFFKIPMMPLMILMEAADLHGCGTSDAQFVRNVYLQIADTVSRKTWQSCG